MIVGFILKKRSSLSQTVSPPNTTTSTAVASCILESVPVRCQSTAVDARISGMNSAVTTTKPS
jgi:hypothetical protein